MIMSVPESEINFTDWALHKSAVFIINEDNGVIMEASPYFAKIFGAPHPSALIGKSIYDLLPDSSSFFEHLKAELLVNNEVEDIIGYFRRIDGTKFRAALTARKLSDSNHIQAQLTDESRLQNLEEAAKLWEYKFHYAQELTESAFFIVKNGRIAEGNQAFYQISGFSPDEIRQGDIFVYDLASEKSLPLLKEKIAGLNHRKRFTGKFSLALKNKLGAELETEAAFALLTAEAELTLIGFIVDNSRIALLESKLYQSQKMEAVGKLASGVAHDFNNLLTAIIGHSDLAVVNLELGKSPKNDLEIIQSAADKASALTRQLLAFSRKQRVEPKILNPNSLIQNMDKMLRRIIGEDIEFVIELGEDVKRIKVDPGQLEQIIVNLSVNARDAMPHGGKLLVETRNVILMQPLKVNNIVIDKSTYVKLTVEDTGTGMTEEVKSKAFDPFFTTKPEGKGTGLGLSTVKEIVDQNNGKICLDSQLGQGTSFQIYFPMASQDAEEYSFAKVRESLPGGKEKILIVEDEISVREFTSRMLKKLGYTVAEAQNGTEAMKVISGQTDDFNLIITDLIMPDMNGLELIRAIENTGKKTKIIYMSGYRPDSFINEILHDGIPYLQKPFNPLDLAKKVREALDH